MHPWIFYGKAITSCRAGAVMMLPGQAEDIGRNIPYFCSAETVVRHPTVRRTQESGKRALGRGRPLRDRREGWHRIITGPARSEIDNMAPTAPRLRQFLSSRNIRCQNGCCQERGRDKGGSRDPHRATCGAVKSLLSKNPHRGHNFTVGWMILGRCSTSGFISLAWNGFPAGRRCFASFRCGQSPKQ